MSENGINTRKVRKRSFKQTYKLGPESPAAVAGDDAPGRIRQQVDPHKGHDGEDGEE